MKVIIYLEIMKMKEKNHNHKHHHLLTHFQVTVNMIDKLIIIKSYINN